MQLPNFVSVGFNWVRLIFLSVLKFRLSDVAFHIILSHILASQTNAIFILPFE